MSSRWGGYHLPVALFKEQMQFDANGRIASLAHRSWTAIEKAFSHERWADSRANKDCHWLPAFDSISTTTTATIAVAVVGKLTNPTSCEF